MSKKSRFQQQQQQKKSRIFLKNIYIYINII
jgi:hypothetical protein